jgi:hypothetical protein
VDAGARSEDGFTDGQVAGVPLHSAAGAGVDEVERVVVAADDGAPAGHRHERDALVVAGDHAVLPGVAQVRYGASSR